MPREERRMASSIPMASQRQTAPSTRPSHLRALNSRYCRPVDLYSQGCRI
jgi:hypothetical protein